MSYVKTKDTHCSHCKKEFNASKKYHARNMCRTCYTNEFYKNKYSKKMRFYECQSCSIKVGELDKKGNAIQGFVRGFCRSCYYKHKTGIATDKCKNCGVKFGKVRYTEFCYECKPSTRWRDKVRGEIKYIKRSQLTKEELYDMLLVFRRYKIGTQTPVDAFRVVDLYLSVFAGQPFINKCEIDNYGEEEQIVKMLSMLKKVYDNV